MKVNKVTKRIGKLILAVTQRKRIGPNKFSETELQCTDKELEYIYYLLGALLGNKKSIRKLKKLKPSKK